MGLLGIFWEPSGSLLRASGGLLGAFLGTFVVGAFWEPLILVGSFREPSGSLLGALSAFGGLLGTFWERLEPSESCGQCLQRQQQLENKSQNLQGAPRLHTKISGRATKMGKNICLKSRGSKNETHSYNAPVCSLIVLLLSHKQRKNGAADSCPCWQLAPRFPNKHFSEFNISQQPLVKIKWK